MKNRFHPEKYHDHTIVDDDQNVVGHIRVKPSSVLWAPKNAKVWYGLPLKEFATYIEAHGNQQLK